MLKEFFLICSKRFRQKPLIVVLITFSLHEKSEAQTWVLQSYILSKIKKRDRSMHDIIIKLSCFLPTFSTEWIMKLCLYILILDSTFNPLKTFFSPKVYGFYVIICYHRREETSATVLEELSSFSRGGKVLLTWKCSEEELREDANWQGFHHEHAFVSSKTSVSNRNVKTLNKR